MLKLEIIIPIALLSLIIAFLLFSLVHWLIYRNRKSEPIRNLYWSMLRSRFGEAGFHPDWVTYHVLSDDGDIVQLVVAGSESNYTKKVYKSTFQNEDDIKFDVSYRAERVGFMLWKFTEWAN